MASHSGGTEAFERILGGQEPDKLPLVLSAEEIEHFLDAVTGMRNRVVLATAYAAGLRASEVVRLKVSSILLAHDFRCNFQDGTGALVERARSTASEC